jgi:FkbM family methyltransferase
VKAPNLLSVLPPDLRITLADVGSAGGLHPRWSPVQAHISALLFDPLEGSTDAAQGRVFPYALAEHSGLATLNVLSRVSMTSTLLPNAERLRNFQDKEEHVRLVETIDVETRTLDEIAAHSGASIDVLKVDVQGGEHGVLEGAKSCLASSIFLAEIEVSFFDRYVGLVPFDGILTLMRELGFDLLDVGRLKRYRYLNSAGIAFQGSGGKDPLGKLAFCDAWFLLRDDLLLERLARAAEAGDAHLLLKMIVALLAYEKEDLACWLFDAAGAALPSATRAALEADFARMSRARRRANTQRQNKRGRKRRWRQFFGGGA